MDQSLLMEFFSKTCCSEASILDEVLGAGRRRQLILCNSPWDQRQRPISYPCFHILHSQAKCHVADITVMCPALKTPRFMSRALWLFNKHYMILVTCVGCEHHKKCRRNFRMIPGFQENLYYVFCCYWLTCC